MSYSRKQTVNPSSYKPLLNLIANAESNGNYNAYYGNPQNKEINFTNMTISEVLDWQQRFLRNGSQSSAVGRYQFLNSTLNGLITEHSISKETLFSASTQDSLAIMLLVRRGSEKYVNKEITKKEFAAELAKEWAALPKTIGDNPDKSFYDGDGLNSSRVAITDVLNAIRPIEAA